MAAENKAAGDSGPSFSPRGVEGRSEHLNAASQISSPVLLTGASVNQSYAASGQPTPILGAASVHILPTVHVTRHPLPVCVASSVSTGASFATSYVHQVRPVNQQAQGSVGFSAVQQPQKIVARPALATVQQAVQQPTAVLDLGNNGILNAVLGRLPNVGTMVVHSLDPASVVQKNIVAMIDSGTATAVTTAAALPVPVVNFQPVLPPAYRGSVTSPVPSRKKTQHAPQHSPQPIIVNQIGSRQPLVASRVAANQHVAFSQPLVTGVTNTCPQRLSAVMRPTVTVRTLAGSGDHQSRLILSMSPPQADGSPRVPSLNSAEMIPRIKLPHVASSLPGAVVRHYITPIASQIHPTVPPVPMQTQSVAALPRFVCRNTVDGSVIAPTSTQSSTLAPSESLTTMLPPQPIMLKPFELSHSYLNASSPAATLSTQSLLVAGSSVVAGDRPAVTQLATPLMQMSTPTNLVSNSSSPSVISTHHSLASYVPPSVPASIVRHSTVPMLPLNPGRVGCSANTKKSPAKRPPRKRPAASAACPVLGVGTSANLAKIPQTVFHGSAVGMHVVSPAKSVMVDPLSDANIAATCASTSALVAGVKRKCSPGQKYTLLLENGCLYSSVYFDGEGFQPKQPAISSAQSGSCCCSQLLIESYCL